MMSSGFCVPCRRPLTTSAEGGGLSCSICQVDLCRRCAQRLDVDQAFSFLPAEDLREELAGWGDTFCAECYDSRVVPLLQEHETRLEEARQMPYWPKGYRKPLKFTRKSPEVLTVKGLRDRDEVLLWLAYKAVRGGFDGLSEVVVDAEKVRNHAYQTMRWSGVARPVVGASAIKFLDDDS